jgi:hypothetical protein
MVTKSELLARVPPLYRLGRALKDARRARPDHRDNLKRTLLRDVAKRYGLRVLVETGTYMGETAWALRRDFDRIETIELEPTLARLARIRFGSKARVRVHEGDSATVLPQILEALDEPALFWLDAHPSTDRTARDAPIPLRSMRSPDTRLPVTSCSSTICNTPARLVIRGSTSWRFPATGSRTFVAWRY